MAGTNDSQSKQILLTGLLLLLVAIVGFQAWYMLGMKSQLDDIHHQQMTVHAQAQSDSGTPSVKVNDNKSILKAEAPLPSAVSNNTPPVKRKSPPAMMLSDDPFTTAYDAQNWDPYAEIQRMQHDMDRMFNDAFNRFNDSPDFQHLFRQGFTSPRMDVQEDDDQYIVIVDLPGNNEKDVSVNLDGQTLTIEGKQNFEKLDRDRNGNVIFQERRSGSFQRSITLPGPVRQTGMETEIDDGVLTIKIPKES